MPAINFKPQFVPPILNGTKTQTIRQVRKNPIKVGDTLYLYTGQRTKSVKKLKEVTCKSVESVCFGVQAHEEHVPSITIDSHKLTETEIEQFYQNDGFHSLNEFCDFFKLYEEPFDGVVIKW